jgi:hypothetical protein
MDINYSYFTLTLLSFIYICYKFRNDLVSIIIILLFYSGMFSSLGKAFENPYKIVTLCLTVYAGIKLNVFKFNQKGLIGITLFFALFSTVFFISAIANENNFVLVYSQYAKFVIPFCFFFIFRYYSVKTPWKFNRLNYLFITLLLIQILLSIFKLMIFGVKESVVGSMAWIGGSEATVFPIIGFVFLWIITKGRFKRKDWIYILGLLFIGFMSTKRAIWFVMPVIMLSFLFYIPIKRFQVKYLFFVFLLPLIFYLGVRLNPSLNKENKVWGDFDLNYAMDYASTYSFGEEDHGVREPGQGRGGATLYLYNILFNKDFFEMNHLLGYGLDEIYTKDYDQFDTEKFGLNSKGAASGVFQSYITNGFLGIFTFLLYALSLIIFVRNIRIRIVLIGFFCWEYFFYTGIVFRTQALTILFLYCIILINVLYQKRIKAT